MKMVETGAPSFIVEGVWQGVVTIEVVGGSEVAFGVDGVDFRELEAQDLIQPTSGHGYELTDIGRIEYEQRKNLRGPRP